MENMENLLTSKELAPKLYINPLSTMKEQYKIASAKEIENKILNSMGVNDALIGASIDDSDDISGLDD